MLKREDVIELDMSVDEALKYIISMGTVAPGANPRNGGWSGRAVPNGKRASKGENVEA